MRRDFLKYCAWAGMGLALPVKFPDIVRAASKEPAPYDGPYYVVFNASGGWDTTYLMDPKGVEGINRLYKEGDILSRGPHHFAPTAKHIEGGLSNEDFGNPGLRFLQDGRIVPQHREPVAPHFPDANDQAR